MSAPEALTSPSKRRSKRRVRAVAVVMMTVVVILVLVGSLVFYYSCLYRTKLAFSREPAFVPILGHTEPEVIKVGTAYYLYYRTDHSIAVAVSSDGLIWSDNDTVVRASASEWDSNETIAPSVLLDNGTYYLYYEAMDSATGHRAIGLATSTSPTGPFSKYGGNPVLTASEPWEDNVVGTPVVTKIGTTFYLFYHGFSDGSDRIGVAYSQSLLGPWTKEPANPILDVGMPGAWDDAKVAPSSVIVSGCRVWVFYEGFDGTNPETLTSWRIGVATATLDPEGKITGLSRDKDPVLDLGQDWDKNTVQLPSVIVEGKQLWMYYSGHDGSAFRLGRAVASVPWFAWP